MRVQTCVVERKEKIRAKEPFEQLKTRKEHKTQSVSVPYYGSIAHT